MKLITKIYLSIGLILFVFVFVTFVYFRQADKVELTMEQVLHNTNIIKTNDNLLRAVLNAQTGLRGYLLSGKENYLEPYHQGLQEFKSELNKLKNFLEPSPENLKFIQKLEEDFRIYNDSIALPLITAKQNVVFNRAPRQTYDRLYNQSYDLQKGKIRIDTIRFTINEIEDSQIQNRNKLLAELKSSRKKTDFLGIILTLLAICSGVATAYILGRSIQRRMTSMKNLAENLAKENFDVELTDSYNDELTSLSADMNIMSKKLQKSFARLQKMNQELDQFAYVVSHDLKAPLRAINNLSEWILEDIGETTPEIQKNLTLMRGRVHRMENLINGILAYSRIGRQEIEKTTFNLQDLLAEIIESIAPPAHFKILFPPDPLTLVTEKILLQQVLLNLLSNAIKYNDKTQGEIKISFATNRQFYQFRVQDNGPGIPQAYHEKIFGVFQTIEARDTFESTGIGLAIVKKIMEEKNGQLYVESEPGQGTTFIFNWPITQAILNPDVALTHA